ncbi:MAG: OmpH family outer membrane protein [Bacteroidetes bacterium]|nr:OmpH family outer membrane protein [Bacteroidota bacterium]
MKQTSTILAIVAIALAAILYFVQSRQIQELKKQSSPVEKKSTEPSGFKIAYFDIDSLQTKSDHFKAAQIEVKAKENDMNQELSSMDRANQKKIEGWRQKQSTMTQAEGELANREYQEMVQAMQSRKQSLEQELYKKTEDLKTTIRREIEEFLKEYNKDKHYSYIFAYDPSSFIYNRDSSYDITPDLVQGLNAKYAAEKKK